MWQLPSSGTIRALVWLSGEQLCLGVQAADTCLLATEHFAGGYSIFFFFLFRLSTLKPCWHLVT